MKWGTAVMNMSPLALQLLVLLPLLVAVGITMGAIILNRDERPEKLWLLADDWVLQDREYRQSNFERATQESLVITTLQDNGDVLGGNWSVLLETYKLHSMIMDINITVTDPQGNPRSFTTWDLCLPSNITLYFAPHKPRNCTFTNVFAFWKYDGSQLGHGLDPHVVVGGNWSSTTDAITQGPLVPEQVVGGADFADNSSLTRAAALKLWYYLDNNFTINNAWPGWQDDVLGAWEDAFLALAAQPFATIRVYRAAGKSDGAVMADAMNNDLPYVVAALLAVIFMVVFYILMSPAMLHDGVSPRFAERALRSFVAVVCAGLSMGSTMGFIGLTGLPFSGVVWYMIFYVLVHLCHAMALLVNALDVVCVTLPTQGRLGAALGAVAPTMLTTSLPIVVMFAALSLTPAALPCVRSLAVAGSFGLCINLVLALTTFTAVLARSIRRQQQQQDAGLPAPPACVGVRGLVRFYSWAAQSWLFKSVVVLCVLGMIGDSINGLITWRQTADEAAIYPPDSYLHQFYVQDNAYFGKLCIPLDIVLHDVDYSKPANGHAMVALADRVLQSPYVYTYSDTGLSNYSLHFSWYNAFLAFERQQNPKHVSSDGTPAPQHFQPDFLEYFTPLSFASPAPFIEFYVDVLTKDFQGQIGNLHPLRFASIASTRMQGFTMPLTDMDAQAAAVEDLRSIASTAGGDLRASVYAPPFYIFRTFTTVRQWTYYSFIATSVACALSVLLTLGPMAAALVMLSLASVSLDTVGLFMHSIGYSFDTTTLPMLMFMIPLATELLVHFAAFAHVEYRLPVPPTPPAGKMAEKGAKPLLLTAAVAAMSYGPATATICCGCLGALLGLLVMMAGVSSPVLYIFGALSSVILGLAAAHVLVLPAFLPGW